jgi:hypothetical protein
MAASEQSSDDKQRDDKRRAHRRKIEQALAAIRPHLTGLDGSVIGTVIAALLTDMLEPYSQAKRAKIIAVVVDGAAELVTNRDKRNGKNKQTIW